MLPTHPCWRAHTQTQAHTCLHTHAFTRWDSHLNAHSYTRTFTHTQTHTYSLAPTLQSHTVVRSLTLTCTHSHTQVNLHQDLIDSVFPYSVVVIRFICGSIRSDPPWACVSPRSVGHSWNCGCRKFVLVYEIVSQGRRWTACNSVRLLRSENACVAPCNGDFIEKHLAGLRSASGARWSWWSHLEAFRGLHQSEEASEEPLDDQIQLPSSVFILDFFFFLVHRYTPHTGVWRHQSPDWSLPLVSKDDNKS